MDNGKVICFHGTHLDDVQEIQENGFQEGTYFAKHLEDALRSGGPWVFQVCFDADEPPPGGWQFCIREAKPFTDIVCLTHYPVIATVTDNVALRTEIFESNRKTPPDAVEKVAESEDIKEPEDEDGLKSFARDILPNMMPVLAGTVVARHLKAIEKTLKISAHADVIRAIIDCERLLVHACGSGWEEEIADYKDRLIELEKTLAATAGDGGKDEEEKEAGENGRKSDTISD